MRRIMEEYASFLGKRGAELETKYFNFKSGVELSRLSSQMGVAYLAAALNYVAETAKHPFVMTVKSEINTSPSPFTVQLSYYSASDQPILGAYWEELTAISSHVSKKVGVKVSVFRHKLYQSSLVIYIEMGVVKNHHAFVDILPFIVDKSNFKAEKWFIDFYKLFYDGYIEVAEEAMETVLDIQKYKEKNLRESIRGFSSSGIETRMESLRTLITGVQEEIQYLYTKIKTNIEKLRSAEKELDGLIKIGVDESTDDELIDFLLANKVVTDVCVKNGHSNEKSLLFTVETALRNFDADYYDSCIDTGKASWFFPANKYYTKEQLKRAWKRLFKDCSYRVKMYCRFSLTPNAGINIERYDMTDVKNGYIANPHLYVHSCMGGYAAMFADAAMEGDCIKAIQIATTSTASVNLGEAASSRFLVSYLFDKRNEKTIINKKTGEEISFNELVNMED